MSVQVRIKASDLREAEWVEFPTADGWFIHDDSTIAISKDDVAIAYVHGKAWDIVRKKETRDHPRPVRLPGGPLHRRPRPALREPQATQGGRPMPKRLDPEPTVELFGKRYGEDLHLGMVLGCAIEPFVRWARLVAIRKDDCRPIQRYVVRVYEPGDPDHRPTGPYQTTARVFLTPLRRDPEEGA